MRSINMSRRHPALLLLLCFSILVVIFIIALPRFRRGLCSCSLPTSTKSASRHESSIRKSVLKQTRIHSVLPSLPTEDNGRLVKLHSMVPRLTGTGHMYVHSFKDHVSDAINRNGYFEKGITRRFIALLKLHPDANVFDFGANIGYYSIIAAHMKRKVVAVEANPINTAVFQKSIVYNQFNKSITVLNVAVGQVSNATVSLATEVGNMGNTIVQDNPKSSVILDYDGKVNPKVKRTIYTRIKTITMNDLVENRIITFPTAIVKMDIQGHELKALKSSEKFFRKINIPAYFMEWVNYQQSQKKDEAKELAEILLKQGYKPYNPSNMAKLKPDAKLAGSWAYDVLFLKDSAYIDLLTDIVDISDK